MTTNRFCAARPSTLDQRERVRGTRPPGGCGRHRARGAILAALAALAPVTLPHIAAAQSLVEQCWSPADLAARPEEKSPRRGAAGHAQRVPAVQLQSFTPIAPNLRGSIRRVTLPKGKRMIALTFDLCEQAGEIAGYDGAIVDYLRGNNVKATFFAGGKWLTTHVERSEQLMADRRFEIGSHGWVHRNVRGLAGTALGGEIVGPQMAYEAVRARLGARQCVARTPAAMSRVAARIGLYRFPYGACNDAALAALATNGLLGVQWDVSAGDAAPTQSATVIANAVTRSVRPGSIVLLHANGRGYNTAAALPLMIPKLRSMGYELVTVSELLAAGTPEIAATCYDHKPGDTDRYDRVFAAFRTEVRRGP
ncbi:MAG: polysaccharide deacetylase family protein [Hyphomicrobiaceae bacterium]|nr:polysaccharide deacetylase family protein [Hyphomicrobiaceae bacterium]